MSTWKELYDDVLQELALYQEEIKLTPEQGMRMLSKAVSRFQALTLIAEDVRTLTPTGSPTLTTTPYAIGSDVYEIVDITDPQGYNLMPSSYTQYRTIIDRANSGEIGYNETPHHYSLTREREGSTLREFELWNGKGMSRIYTVWANQLYRYPAEPGDTSLTMRYRPNYEQYSAASAQWAAWFVSETAFETNFATLTPPAQLARYFPALVDFAVSQYLRSQNVLSGEQPLWMQYYQGFQDYVDQANLSKQEYSSNMVAPYNISPFSS